MNNFERSVKRAVRIANMTQTVLVLEAIDEIMSSCNLEDCEK